MATGRQGAEGPAGQGVRPAGGLPAIDRDRTWIAVVCGYFAFQVAWRRLLGGGLALDEAEILLWSRHLAWGYGPQPPLYSWLQWGFLQAIPDPLLALSLLKNLLLAATYLAVYALLRQAHPPRDSGLAALALLLVPQIAWDSQRDMTHTVLATLLAALATLVFWCSTLPGRRGGWIGFGLVVGLGVLAKPNVVVVHAALVLAAASLPELRPRLRPGGLVAALLVAAALVVPPGAWALAHRDLAFASTGKLKMARPGLATTAAGLRAVALAAVRTLGLGAAVLGIVLWRRRERAVRPAKWPLLDRFLGRVVLIGAVLAASALLAAGATNVRPLWLTPIVYLAPPLLTLRLLGRTGSGGRVLLARILGGLALLVVIGLAVNIRYGDPGNPALNQAPVGAAADAVLARFPDATRIIAEPAWLAGSLVHRRPDLPVAGATDPGPAPGPDERVVAIWWDGDRTPDIVAKLSRAWGQPVALEAPTTVSEPWPLQPTVPFEVTAARVRD